MGINLTFTNTIPATNNNPSNDQPGMLVNNASTNTWVAIDHYGFGDNNGGLHKWARMPVQLAVPGGTIAGEGTIYTKTAGEGSLFYTPDATADEYQITRTIHASKALFGLNTNNYNGVGANYNGGWTFLPGGLLLQYGTFLPLSPFFNTNSNGLISFPVSFTATPFQIILTWIGQSGINPTDNPALSYRNGSLSTTQFRWENSEASKLYDGISWMAIGV